MAIIQNQPNLDNSPWYKIMEERAEVWNKFASDRNIPIAGYYNANIVSFKIANHKLVINGKRQVSNVGTIWYGLNQVSEELILTITNPVNSEARHVRIRKSRPWNSWKKKLNHTIIYKGYFITYNEDYMFKGLKKIGLFEFKRLKKLIITDKELKLVLHELPQQTSILNLFLNYFHN